MSWRVVWFAAAFFVLGVGAAVGGRLYSAHWGHAGHGAHGGGDAGAVALADLPLRAVADGGAATLREAAGGAPVLVNFWATWCAPCVAEMPLLDAAGEALGVAVAGVSFEERELMAAFGERLGVSYPLYKSSFDIFYFFQQQGNKTAVLPYTVLLDGGGAVVAEKVGEFSSAGEIAEFVAVLGNVAKAGRNEGGAPEDAVARLFAAAWQAGTPATPRGGAVLQPVL